ncbi:hypothetical protein [Shimia sediminis]|uniref:hypothetical protein n=1 Tax=Shimia sediminis TaxID=2497945 RepID=UPI000F8D432E|nr:hypothetical protein [Shimia sediminis]
MKLAPIALICLLIAACTPFPEVDEAARADVSTAKFPKVVPMEDIIDPPEARLDENSEAHLEGRISGLKRRAKTLEALTLE